MAQPLHGPTRFNRNRIDNGSTENDHVPPIVDPPISMRESDDKGIDTICFKTTQNSHRKKSIINSSEIGPNGRGVNLPFIEMENESVEKRKERSLNSLLAFFSETLGEHLFEAAQSGDLNVFIGQDDWEDTRINDLNENGESFLYLSAMHGHYPIVQWLIYHGADLNFQIKTDGNSALHMAAIHGNVSVVRFLVIVNLSLRHL